MEVERGQKFLLWSPALWRAGFSFVEPRNPMRGLRGSKEETFQGRTFQRLGLGLVSVWTLLGRAESPGPWG